MEYWFEVLKGFDDTGKKYTKESKYQQATAVLALMYLMLGKDYPYNMAKNFQSALAIEKGFDILKHEGKIARLLKEMKSKELLISVPDMKAGHRPRNFYKINPGILQSDKAPTEKAASLAAEEKGFIINMPVDLIEKLLAWLEESYSSDTERRRFIVKWSFIENFDFITFLLCLKEAALAWELFCPKNDSKNKLSDLIEEYIKKLEYKYERTPAFRDIVLRGHEIGWR